MKKNVSLWIRLFYLFYDHRLWCYLLMRHRYKLRGEGDEDLKGISFPLIGADLRANGLILT